MMRVVTDPGGWRDISETVETAPTSGHRGFWLKARCLVPARRVCDPSASFHRLVVGFRRFRFEEARYWFSCFSLRVCTHMTRLDIHTSSIRTSAAVGGWRSTTHSMCCGVVRIGSVGPNRWLSKHLPKFWVLRERDWPPGAQRKWVDTGRIDKRWCGTGVKTFSRRRSI